ncbi:MAG: HEPN domain-containing protein [Thermoproteus sp.]
MARGDVEVLRERALAFLESAKDDLRAGRVDIAAFHCEQAVQLALKYLLAREAGSYPHTHSLRRLFEEAARIRRDLWELYESRKMAFEVMEDAYIGARYLPRRYARDVVEELLRAAEEAVRACLK